MGFLGRAKPVDPAVVAGTAMARQQQQIDAAMVPLAALLQRLPANSETSDLALDVLRALRGER